MQPIGDGVFILGESEQRFSASPLLATVLSLIDGTRETDAIIAGAAGFSAAEVHYALHLLRGVGLIGSHHSPKPPPPVQPRLYREGAGLRIEATRPDALDLVCDALRDHGLTLAPVPEGDTPSTVRVVLRLTDDYLAPGVLDTVPVGDPAPLPRLPVKLTGLRAYFGPPLGGGSPQCATCLSHRLQANRPVESFLAATLGRPFGTSPTPGLSPQSTAAARDLAARLAAGLAGGTHPFSRFPVRAIVEHQATGLRLHTVGRAAACPTCGQTGDRAGPLPPQWTHTPKTLRAGGYRVRGAGDVAAALAPIVSDLVGYVSGLGPLQTNSGPGTRHVWAATYPIVPRAPQPGGDDFHGTALGKGRSLDQARASALCEAVERISAQDRGDLTACVATVSELGETCVSPEALWLFSDRQYATRAAWNATTTDTRRHVPARLSPDTPLPWARAWSLGQERWIWLPREHCVANAPEPRHGRFDPNGCAAGSSLDEAAVQGILELIERDCAAIWWYNRLSRPGVDPLTLADPVLTDLARGFAAQGWPSWLLDLTSDLQVPCFAALARAEADGRWCIGFGCHFEPGIAMERAMTELAQLFRIDGRDGPPPWQPLADETFLYPHGTATPTSALTGNVTTLTGLIDWTVARLARAGIDLLLLDQTHPGIGLPVVKMTAPGLRHFWPRLGHGRLYDVPVVMGWRAAPMAEADLNPVHLFL